MMQFDWGGRLLK